MMDEKHGLIEFLLRAKRATYAGRGPESASSRPCSHDLQYEEGNLLYIDSYLGRLQFAGEEAVWVDGQPVWAMNYVGRVLAEGFSGDFLKEALSKVTPDRPYRGPEEFVNGPHRYTCQVQGEFEWFSGYEAIFSHDKKVYECLFHGGKIV